MNTMKGLVKMSNYPCGTGPNDPRAPWNEPDPIICEECNGTGSVLMGGSEPHTQWNDKCPACKGTGQQEEIEEDLYEKEKFN